MERKMERFASLSVIKEIARLFVFHNVIVCGFLFCHVVNSITCTGEHFHALTIRTAHKRVLHNQRASLSWCNGRRNKPIIATIEVIVLVGHL